MLELDPELFAAYTEFSAHPWHHGTLEPKIKEFIYIAFDTAATHLYVKGLKLHIENALGYGATPQEILEVMEIASVLGIHAVTSAAPILAELLRGAQAADLSGGRRIPLERGGLQVVQEVLGQVRRVRVPLAGGGEVAGQREVDGSVGQRGQQGGQPVGVAGREAAGALGRGDHADLRRPGGAGRDAEFVVAFRPGAVDEPEPLRELHGPRDVAAHRGTDGLLRRQPFGHGGRHCGALSVKFAGGDGRQQGFLVREVLVGRVMRDAGPVPYFAQGHRLAAALVKQLGGDGN